MPTTTISGVGWHTWTVPTGVTAVRVTLNGAGSAGVRGGKVSGVINVPPGTVLYFLVGQGGISPGSGLAGGAATIGGGARGGRGEGSGATGGWSGGGATFCRQGSTTGTVRGVAGGAGGKSGDDGEGGAGGAATGAPGTKGNGAGPGGVQNATGGTQSAGGAGATSGSGPGYAGEHAPNTPLTRGGHGGDNPSGGAAGNGGGGGGGGWYGGGGGAAQGSGVAAGSGGGGGSNYTGGLSGASSERGTGSLTNGFVVVQWTTPGAGNPPTVPSEVTINGQPEIDGLQTRSMGNITIQAKTGDADPADSVRLLVRLSTTTDFSTYADYYSPWVLPPPSGTFLTANITGLSTNTHYYGRVYAQDSNGIFSTSYNGIDFWTNQKPVAELLTPVENAQFVSSSDQTFTWDFTDPDTDSTQRGWRFRYRIAANVNEPAGPWINSPTFDTDATGGLTSYLVPGGTFRSNTFYEWSVQVQDGEGLWGDWAFPFSFYSTGTTAPPKNLSPGQGVALDVSKEQTFTWRFVDPSASDRQCDADLRYRVVGTTDWVTLFGDGITPGPFETLTLPASTFQPGHQYEWQVRTYDGGPLCVTSLVSDWSESAYFWAVARPGSLSGPVIVPGLTDLTGELGCGTHRVFVYARGGERIVGEITPITQIQWSRKRDDISNCLITTNGFGSDCGSLLAGLHCWMHEIVVFRDGQRVWEGPITRIGYEVDQVSIEAQDVMAYVYRRIMRQGYNDAYRLVNGVQEGLKTVVERASIITMNALAPDDPNVLPYLTLLTNEGDARQSRVVPDFSRTAWEEIDDLAATAGLDYTTVGRRIIYWDTHQQIGRLPELRDGDFSQPPIVSEYGMLLANFFATTNNNGIWGGVYATEEQVDPTDPTKTIRVPVPFKYYGLVEMLASAYGEAEAGEEETLTPAARQALVDTLTSQASRSLGGRWPTPVIVRVPDNATLSPKVNVDIQHLVPGVWIPLRSTQTLRQVSQLQKLDSITVTEDQNGERVAVVMSPAPDPNRDPDADASAQEV
jgi:hypothetical protein